MVLYIGATKNIEKRIARHVRDQQIGFCDVYFDPCEESELAEREATAIAEFRPVLFGQEHATIADESYLRWPEQVGKPEPVPERRRRTRIVFEPEVAPGSVARCSRSVLRTFTK